MLIRRIASASMPDSVSVRTFSSALISGASGISIADDEFVNHQSFNVLDGVAGKIGCVGVGEYAFSTALFSSASAALHRGAAGIDHIVNHHAVTTSDVTDDVHHLKR